MRAIALIVTLLGLATSSHAITRDEVMARAKAFAYHPWRCATANLTASCSASYKSVYSPGDYVGLPYDWGGYMTKFEFDQQIAQGHGAGSQPGDGVLACTAGLDCSGYVSKCWDAGHFSTSTLGSVSTAIAQSQLLPGDVLNMAGLHVVLFSHKLASGEPVFFEAGGYNTHINLSGGWSHVAGYTPRRYNKITGSSAGNPSGTTENPIAIGSLPYSDSRDTTQAVSDVLDGCGASPTKNESGPEYIYKVTLQQPGTLTASVSDGPGVDIDVHLYTSMNTGDCVARDDLTLSHAVDCGTYYVVADTFTGSVAYPGPYTLTVSFTPSGSGCGSGPPAYSPKGKPGDACGYPANPNLPFCNENLGGEICIYTTGSSFCSLACKTSADCAVFPGGCCQDVSGKGEYYCLTAAFCGGPATDGGPPMKPDAGADSTLPPLTDGPAPWTESGLPPLAGDGGSKGDGGEETGGGGGCSLADPRSSSPAPTALLLLALLSLVLGGRRVSSSRCAGRSSASVRAPTWRR